MTYIRNAIAVLLTCSLTAACADTSFNGSTKNLKSRKAPASEDAAKSHTQTFDIQRTNSKLDLIWVVDQSGSMREEIAQVKRNLDNFLATLSPHADIRIAVIAGTAAQFEGQTEFAFQLGQLSESRQQVDVMTLSKNPLAMLAANICEKPPGSGITGGALRDRPGMAFICGKDIVVEGAMMIRQVAGKLANFLRPDAKHVFVVVSDDNANAVDDKNFLSLIGPRFVENKPTVFGFTGGAGQSSGNCTIRNPGVAYEQLARVTGGKTFNICDSDWTPHFSALTASIKDLLPITLNLNAPADTITSIKVDGRSLNDADYYLVDEQKIQIRKNALSPGSKSVEVTWH